MRDVDEDDYEARPRRRYQTERYDEAPRYTQRRHKRTAKRARRHQHAATRRAARRTAERRSHRTRTAARSTQRNRYNDTGGSGAQGIASYYWQPQRVAAGGWFNPEAMTAAHRTLPFGTRVRVTHAASGRSVNVVINDRGPYIAGRIIDLSRGAARVIGMTGQGLARVKVQVLGRSGS